MEHFPTVHLAGRPNIRRLALPDTPVCIRSNRQGKQIAVKRKSASVLGEVSLQ